MNGPNSSSKRPAEILVVSHYYDAHGGGIERTARRLIEELAALGQFHFTWAASGGDGSELPAGLTGQKILPMRDYNLLERLCGVPWPVWGRKSLRQLRDAVRQADI